MDEAQFTDLVGTAIDRIPEPYQSKLDNVTFKVEQQPSDEQRKRLGLRKCDALFGLYEGVPLTKRGGAVHSIVPDVITIFMQPMLRLHPDVKRLEAQIYKTVWHEVAHYYGLDHDRIHQLEQKKQSSKK